MTVAAMQPVPITLTGISKAYEHGVKGQIFAVNDVSLTVVPGELLTLLGPSGCGKTTTLRMIAGFEQPTSGSIHIGDRDVTGLRANERNIGFVFQNYAIFPHLSVFENVAYGLRVQNKADDEIKRAVQEVLELVGLSGYAQQQPHQLSGGEQQRVALARAIVFKPRILLFDEPLSNLDASLRNRMRFEFAALHRQLGTTTVYVTHDQIEAMTLADRIVVMREGAIEQIGSPAELYQSPVNRFVAGFIGSPQMNFLDGTVTDAGAAGPALELVSGERIALPAGHNLAIGAPVTIGVRPEHWHPAPDEAGLTLRADFIERLGSGVNIHLHQQTPDRPLLVWHHIEPAKVSEGETIRLVPDPAHLHLFGPDGRSLATA